MSDRSDEATESRDTDDLLTETEDLLSEAGVGGDAESGAASPPADRAGTGPDGTVADEPAGTAASAASADSDTDADTGAGSGSRLAGLASWLSVDDYFSPRAFLAVALLVGAGLIAGEMVLPFGGRAVGMFGVAFAAGLLTSKRRYLEVGTAGVAVGGLSSVLGNAVLSMAGSFRTVAAIGVAIGLLACVIGYYFGRDLRRGLTQDIE